MVLCNLIQGKVRENIKETYLTEFKIILLYINQRRVQDFFLQGAESRIISLSPPSLIKTVLLGRNTKEGGKTSYYS